MTYSRPSTGQVDAFGEIGNPMAITRQGLRSKTTLSKTGAYQDNRDPSQIGRNAQAKAKQVDDFVSFLTKDIAPLVKTELQDRGKAAAMEAVTSIPGMADGSFYRQSDAEQKKVLKDYNLNGYALDQLKSYGAGIAVGRYKAELPIKLLNSPILQSDAPQEQRDQEKQRILGESRALLQNIDPGYLSKYAPELSSLEGTAIGKVEGLALTARNENLENQRVENSTQFWKDAGSALVQVADRPSEEQATIFTNGTLRKLEESWLKGRSTQTPKEWFASTEQGMFTGIEEAIKDNDPALARSIVDTWGLATSQKWEVAPGVDMWSFANKAGVDGQTTAKKLMTYTKMIDKLYDERRNEIVVENNSELIARMLDGDEVAKDLLDNQVIALYSDGKVEEAKALSQAMTDELGRQESRFRDDPTTIASLRSLMIDPETTDQEMAEAINFAIAQQGISAKTGAAMMQRRYTPTQLQTARDTAIQYAEERVVGTIGKDEDNKATLIPGEDEDVNDAIEIVRKLTGGEEYLTKQFLGRLAIAVESKFVEGEPIPQGQALRDLVKAESIKLLREKAKSIQSGQLKTKKGKEERVKGIIQPILDAITEGKTKDEIWGDEINDYARKSRTTNPADVWKARLVTALIGMKIDGTKEVYDRRSAEKEAKKQLELIRRRYKAQQQQNNAPKQFTNSSNSFAPAPVPIAVEIDYDTAMPGMQEDVVAASKSPDQEGDQGLLAVAGRRVLEGLGRVLPGGSSPAAAGELDTELRRVKNIQNTDGWKTLNRMFARRQRVSATTQPLPQVSATALTDTVAIAMTSDRHPMMVHIGIAEGTRTISGGYTRHYYGHRDRGDSNWNRGTVSGGRGMGNAAPQQVDAFWMRELTARGARIAPVMARAGLRPGTVGYNRLMFNYLDLAVQSPKAADSFAAKLSSMKAGGWSIEVIAKARADSFFSPVTGRLEASGFGNNYSKLLGDQRSRAGVWDYKKRI